MQLLELKIQGFKSFDEQQVIDFSGNQAGLYLLTGENQAEPDLGANGAGKSTVLDALVWVLYDQTTRKLKAKNIKNWYGKNKVSVSLKFISRHDKEIELTRTWQPNSLKWIVDGTDLATVTQAELEEEIGLNFDTFTSSLMVPQFATMFFDEKPTAQAQIFTEILDLDEWLSYSDSAKNNANYNKTLLADVEEEIATCDGKLQAWEELDYEEDVNAWEEDRTKRIREASSNLPILKTDAKKAAKEASKYDDDLENLQRKLSELVTVSSEIKQDISEVEHDKKEAEIEARRVEDTIVKLRAEINIIERDIKKFEKLEGTCSSCKQPIDEKHKEHEIEKLDDKIEALLDKVESKNSELQKADKKVSSFDDELSDLDAEMRELDEEYDTIRESKSGLELSQSKAKSKAQQLSKEIRLAEGRKSAIEGEENPFISKKKDTDKRIANVKARLADLERDAEKLRKVLAQFTYWTKSFKDVRLFLISEALTQLEVEVNRNLVKLGMAGWSITFDVESAKADGTLKKGFNILIKSPSNKEAVPWQSWSGGETQRLRIAGITGLTNLILNRKGIIANCEFWDEPTNGINAKGVTNLLSTLRDHARESNRQVWLIDHRSLSQGDFKKKITVVKDSEGSWFDEE